MSVKNEYINTLFIALMLSSCVFLVVDIAYGERIWELDTFAIKARVKAMSLMS